MRINDLLKYLVRNKKITVSKMSDFKISFDDIKEICDKMNWVIKEEDGIIFFFDNEKLIEDFTSYSVDDHKYKHIVIILNNQNDCDKLRNQFPILSKTNQDINLTTNKVVVDSMESIQVFNTRKVKDQFNLMNSVDLNNLIHTKKTWEQFDNWRCMPEYYYNFRSEEHTSELQSRI